MNRLFLIMNTYLISDSSLRAESPSGEPWGAFNITEFLSSFGMYAIYGLAAFALVPRSEAFNFYSFTAYCFFSLGIIQHILCGFNLTMKVREIGLRSKDFLEQKLKTEISLLEKQNELEKLNSELTKKTLIDQMKPHVLFNSLNMISNYIDISQDKAQEALVVLAGLYRDILKASNRYTWTLREELMLVSKFMELQKYRFEERVTFEVVTDNVEPYEIYLPCMLLHTFVENAVEYGLEINPEGGLVRIEVSKSNGGYLLKVVDTGSNDKLTNGQVRKGFGLENSKRRLMEMYGEKSNLSFSFNHLGSVISCWVSGDEIEVLTSYRKQA